MTGNIILNGIDGFPRFIPLIMTKKRQGKSYLKCIMFGNLSNHNLLAKTFSLNRPFALRGHGKSPFNISPAIPADSMLLPSARLCARLLPKLYLKVKKQ